MTTDAVEIRSLLDQRAHAVRAKDAEAAVRPYAPDAVNFDLARHSRTGAWRRRIRRARRAASTKRRCVREGVRR
jgi:ketosteroid isomerase-like protein